MQALELRKYKFKELRELFHISRNDTISDYLKKWGYSFNLEKGKGITITEYPSRDNIEGRIAEIVMRKYGKTANINVRDFACLLFMLSEDEVFQTAPWEAREKILKEQFNCTTGFEAMKKWVQPMYKNGDLVKDKEDGKYWRSMRWRGEKCQEMIDQDDENERLELENYINKRREYLEQADIEFSKAIGVEGASNPNRWKLSFKKLWDETHTYIYKSPATKFNGIHDEDLEELYSLIPLLIMGIEEELEQEEEEQEEIAVAAPEIKPFNALEDCTGIDGAFKF